jgi:hypothetical protein
VGGLSGAGNALNYNPRPRNKKAALVGGLLGAMVFESW